MKTQLQYGHQKEAYHRGTNYFAWKFPGTIDDTAPDWITREVDNKVIKQQEDGTWRFKNLTVNTGDVFMYHSVKMEVTLSDSGIFQSHFFVVYDEPKETEKQAPTDSSEPEVVEASQEPANEITEDITVV